ncbi:MAG: PH domain-containing protein [Anaerolineales bacterium]|nr:PH domain-containing protein [Anaerolineales bacterium]
MEEKRVYYPPKRIGTIVHLLLILLFSSGGAWGIWGISNVQVALQLLPYLVLILLFLISVPFLIYRFYALHRSQYVLERGGIQLHWGWRSEHIPMDQVKWVHKATDLEIPPQPPLIRWPGSVIGFRRLSRSPSVEFMASRDKELVIIAVDDGYFAISPLFVDDFINSYNSLTELGSLSLITTESARPALFLTELSGRKPVLWIFLAGAILSITLLIWTLLVIPSRDKVSLGFSPGGTAHEPLESVRLILFPIINTTAYLGNLVLGLFLFRNEENRVLAYILWGGSLLIAIIFHIGMLFILQ